MELLGYVFAERCETRSRRIVSVVPLTFDRARIIVGDGMGVFDSW